MAASAQSLRKASAGVRMEQPVRNRTLELCAQLSEVAGEVAAGLAGLDEVSAKSVDEIREVLRTLTALEAQMIQALSGFTGLVETLEQAAERDEANEPAYVLVVEAAGALLQSFEQAKSATETLRTVLAGRRG
jgi:uncharacterized protein with von Willebrand factor type A (vWA) domain